MPSPNRRSWTLSELERDLVYVLWFEPRGRRWEVSAVGQRDVQQDQQREAGRPRTGMRSGAASRPRPPRHALGPGWCLPS